MMLLVSSMINTVYRQHHRRPITALGMGAFRSMTLMPVHQDLSRSIMREIRGRGVDGAEWWWH